MQLSASSNLLIGTTNETGLTGAGGLKINSSTAGSAGAGALVVTGGLSAGNNGNASYFGGVVTATSGTSPQLVATESGSLLYAAVQLQATSAGGKLWTIASNATGSPLGTASGLSFRDSSIGTTYMNLTTTGLAITGTLSTTGAATFAGAVSGAAATFRPASDGVGLTLNQANSASAGWSFSPLNSGSLTVTRIGGVIAMTCDLNGNTAFNTSTTQTFGSVVISSGNSLKLGNAYVGTPVVSTGYITIQDNTGTTYKVAVSL